MKKPELTILCVGKLKEFFWLKASEHYLDLLEKVYNVRMREIRDAAGKLLPEEKKRKEGALLLENLPPGFLYIGLWELGKLYTSVQFAAQMQSWENENRKLCFIIGGPHGLAKEVQGKCVCLLSLSPLTWPHEMARILLLEQIYRAAAINQHRPYHH